MTIAYKNIKKSFESLNFTKEMNNRFGLVYEKDYELVTHIKDAKRMTSKKNNPQKIIYHLCNAMSLDDGDGSGSFILFKNEIPKAKFIKIVEFTAAYLNANYENYM